MAPGAVPGVLGAEDTATNVKCYYSVTCQLIKCDKNVKNAIVNVSYH